ncbi:efflux transporter outer membrane subunit [Neptunomonas qingdaonensis]|uniref:Outer membrane protein, multidrug efflux system n=1 Tax=Neptunomonas qingdaonensis TaxID=1045558 RepID=A0A1I2MBP2_9GAMM|nr:efflux transporter outer membrane subunit [Neptunomonas qingdaonensis]SFF86947.1 outer membrane protein, multidrug efflux system [Neptunomonas qingdaonensis]
MHKQLLAVVVSGVLAGCSLAPDYQRPDVDVINAWTPAEQQTAAMPLGWEAVFNDAALQQLIQLGLESNKDLQIALLNVELYRKQYRIQRADLLPSLTLDGSGTRTATSAFSNNSSISSAYSVTAGTSYELDLFGKVRNLKDQALETYLAQEQTQRSTQLTIIASIATAYLTWVADTEQLQLAKESLKIEEDNYRLVTLRYDQGIDSSIVQAQAQASYEDMLVTLSQFQRLVDQDRYALVLLLGTELPDSFKPDERLEDVKIATVGAGLPSTLLNQRPDILAAEHALRAANANIGVARAALFPSISLTANAGTQSSELSGLFDSGSGAWTFAPSISLPIFNSGALRRDVEVAEIENQIAVKQYEQAVQGAFTDVSDALTALSGYATELENQNKALKSYQRYFDLADLRYQSGVDSMLTRLDAQSSLVSSQQASITARLALYQSQIDLYKALGGGWAEEIKPLGTSAAE